MSIEVALYLPTVGRLLIGESRIPHWRFLRAVGLSAAAAVVIGRRTDGEGVV